MILLLVAIIIALFLFAPKEMLLLLSLAAVVLIGVALCAVNPVFGISVGLLLFFALKPFWLWVANFSVDKL